MRFLSKHLLQRLLASRFLRDTGVLASGVFVAQVIVLVISPLLTRLFSPEHFGVFSLVVAVASMVTIFATLRLETLIPAVRAAPDAMRLMQAALGLTMSTGAAAFVLVSAFRAETARLLSIPADAAGALFVAPFLIIAFGLFACLRAWCIRTGRFKVVSRGQVARAITAAVVWLGLGFGGVLKAPGLALAAGQAVADFAFSGMLSLALRRHERRMLLTPRLSAIRRALADNARMVWTLVSSQALATIYGRLPIIVIATVFGPVQAGFYALAERMVGAPVTLVANAIGDVYRQRAAAAHRRGEPFDGLMRNVLLLTLSLSVVPFIAAIAIVPQYMGPLFGPEWTGAGFTMAILLVGALVSFNSVPVDKAALIVGASRYILVWHAVRFAIEVGAALCAVARLLSYESYLIAVVTGRAGLYLLDVFVELHFARTKA